MSRDAGRFALFHRIEKAALWGGLLAVVCSALTGDFKIIGGVLVGAAIGWLNVNAVRSMLERSLAGMSEKTPARRLGPGRVVRGGESDAAEVPDEIDMTARKNAVLVAFALKFVVLLVLITVVVLVVGVNAIALIVGFSVSVAAVVTLPLLNPLFEGKDGAGTNGR